MSSVTEKSRDAHPVPAMSGTDPSACASRRHIPTPALVCDFDLLLDNIDRMAALALAAGVGVRPHVKSHKSATIARLQLDSGAVGLACAKLAEAEVLVKRLRDDGYRPPLSILLTSPLAGPDAARRAALLSAQCELLTVVDHPDGVRELARASHETGTEFTVLCDVDVGLGRTGVVGASEALRVVEQVVNSPTLTFGGVQGYGGHLQHVVGFTRRRDQTRTSSQRLGTVTDALEARGYAVALRTGGGTGTCAIDVEIGLLNELQPGSYVFMDRQYRDALGDDPGGAFHQSLVVATTVLSVNQIGFVTVDAGLKSMATDAGRPLVLGHETTVLYDFFGDEHGRISSDVDGPFERGQRFDLVPPHCDPTVDRYDVIWLVRDDLVVGIADVVARGRSQ